MVEFFYVFSQPPLSKSGGLAVGCFMLVSMLILQFHVLQPCEVWVCFLHVFNWQQSGSRFVWLKVVSTFLVIMGANQSSSSNRSPTDDVIQCFGWRSSIFFNKSYNLGVFGLLQPWGSCSTWSGTRTLWCSSSLSSLCSLCPVPSARLQEHLLLLAQHQHHGTMFLCHLLLQECPLLPQEGPLLPQEGHLLQWTLSRCISVSGL